MERRERSALVTGIILILAGLFFLIFRMVPTLFGTFSWPFLVIGVGVLLLVIALVTWTPGLAVPACVVGGIGALLYWQNATGEWWTWSFTWTLIPGFVGVGVAVSQLLEGRPLRALREGAWPILISALLFFLFGSFFNVLPWQGPWWAVVLIAIGVLVLLQPLLTRKRG